MFSVPIFIPLTEQFVSILFTVRQFRANIINLRPRTNSFDLFVYPIVSHLESYPQVIHHGQVACNIRIQCQGTTVGSKIELNLNTTVFVEYSSKCRRKLLKILARIQSSPGTLNVQRVFSDSFLQEIQRSSIFVFPSDV